MEDVYNEFEEPNFTEEVSITEVSTEDTLGEVAPQQSDSQQPSEQKAERKTPSIEISNEVVEIVAGIAASKTPGVAEMAGGGGAFAEILGRKNPGKGVRVEVKEGNADIDVFIIAKQGRKLGQIFLELQRNVKDAVENMTGLVVNSINVYTQGLADDEEGYAAEE